MTRRLATLVLGAATLLSCTSTGDRIETPDQLTTAPASASNYTFGLTEIGGGERHALIAPVPVGRQADVTVSLASLGETIDVQLEATVAQAGADGESQLIELVIVGVEADDVSTVDALSPIIGASSSLVRDRRLSMVEQQLDVQAGLAFRADTVARQALRAPFVLVGPLALEPVGDGASWSVETSESEAVVISTNVEVISSSVDGFQLRFDVPEGVVEIWGRAGALLPDRQVITLDNATLTVVAERSN